MHNATLEIFDPGDSGFDYDALIAHIDDRITFVPRYRQHVRRVPGRIANPVWVDDEDFDLAYHVRRSACRAGHPRPAPRADRPDHVAPARPRPPAVGGLLRRGARGRTGRAALQVPPDPGRRHLHRRPRPGAARRRPGPRQLVRDDWVAPTEPTPARLAASAVVESARNPKVTDSTVRSNAEALGRPSVEWPEVRRRRRRAVQPPAPAPSRRSTSSRPSSAGWSWCAPR